MTVSAALPAAAGIAAGTAAYAVRGRTCSWLAPSVHRGNASRPAIALTFDDGPSESTPALLDLLARYSARATFFQCGANVRRLPAVARQVAEAGHEIGNHTDTHPYFHFKSPGFMHRELKLAQDTIRDTTGNEPKLFRSPFGIRWFGMGRVQRSLGLMGVMWTRIGVDWKWPESSVAEHLARGAQNGAILCLHDGRELQPKPDVQATLGAVRRLLPALIGQGFHFEKVSEILCPTT